MRWFKVNILWCCRIEFRLKVPAEIFQFHRDLFPFHWVFQKNSLSITETQQKILKVSYFSFFSQMLRLAGITESYVDINIHKSEFQQSEKILRTWNLLLKLNFAFSTCDRVTSCEKELVYFHILFWFSLLWRFFT